MKISIIGSGVVGKATGIGFHKFGYEVIFYDITDERLTELKNEGYEVTRDIDEAIYDSTVSFICVPTPTRAGKMVFTHVKKATIDVARAQRKKGAGHLVVVRSTVLPTTTRTRIVPLLEKHSKLKAGEHFGVCMNPEFAREIRAVQDFLNPSRIVIGELDEQSGELLQKMYASLKAPIIRTDLDTAEMIKYVANCFLATKISFFNEIYLMCKKFRLDPNFVAEAAALDPRIGNYGIYGGRPFEGACLSKDLEAFTSFVRNRMDAKLLDAVKYVNKKISNKENRTSWK